MKTRQDGFLIFMVFGVIYSIVIFTFHSTFNKLLLNYLFTIILIVTGFQLSDLPYKRLISLLRYASIIVILLVSIKNILYAQEIISFLELPNGHPQIPYFFGGGSNLEATWLAINLSLFIGKRKQLYLLGLITILTSAIYASRSGVVLNTLVIFIHVFIYSESKPEKMVFTGVIIAPVIIFIIYNFRSLVLTLYLFERFSTTGSDAGSNERLVIWQAGIESFIDSYFFGYGAGNAIEAVKHRISHETVLDNVHNYYLQVLLDFGIIGFLLFLIAIIIFFISFYRSKNVLKYAFYLYLVGCLIQFRGGEPIIWFMYALLNKSKDSNE